MPSELSNLCVPAEVHFPAEVRHSEPLCSEVIEMLNGFVPALPATRCACSRWMPYNNFGEPCGVCLEERGDAEIEAALWAERRAAGSDRRAA